MSDDSQIDVSAIRQELGLSQSDFGEKVGVDQSTVSLWETGKTEPRGPARNWMLKLLEQHRESKAA